MTKRHYIALAAALKRTRPDLERLSNVSPAEHTARLWQWRHDVTAVSEVLADDNDRFNHHRFVAACGEYD